MGDLRFTILLFATVLAGYFNRDELFEDFLARYNDEFPDGPEVVGKFQVTFDFISECGFDRKSRIWRKADLFSAIVEIYSLIDETKNALQPSVVLKRLLR